MSKTIPANRFHMRKVSLCGNQRRWDFVPNLTLEECHDETRFPGGKQWDEARQEHFIWAHALMFEYC